MAFARPFAYNIGSVLNGTSQIGDIAIGGTAPGSNPSYGGLRWWNGPNEALGFVICNPVPSGNQPNPDNQSAFVGFRRSSELTLNSFLELANSYPGSPGNFTTGTQAKTWLNANGYWTSWPGIVVDGLLIQLDANDPESYPGSGTTVYDLTGSYNHTLSNAPYTNLNGVKCFDCNGANTIIEVNGTGPTLPTNGYTYVTWARIKTSSASWRTLFRSLPNDHPILVQIATDNLGFYDNDLNEFKDSGYDVTSIEDVWVQYTVVGDSSSSIFYINGTQVGTTAFGAGGNRHWAWGSIVSQPFGYVANLYLYNRKLSLDEITQQFNFLFSRF